MNNPYIGVWRLTAVASAFEDCPAGDEKSAIPYQHAWLAGHSEFRASELKAAGGIELEISADHSFRESLISEHPSLVWFDATGIQIGKNNFTPLNGVLEVRARADGSSIAYVTLPGHPAFDRIMQGRHGEIIVRCDEHDITLCEFIERAEDRLVRTINCVGDAFYFSRFVAIYERCGP